MLSSNILKDLKRIAVLFILIICMLIEMPVSAEAVVSDEDYPDYEIWMADSMINGIEDSGNGWYRTFRTLQDPIYRSLGASLLEDEPLIVLDTTWSVFLNSEYRNQLFNNQEYIYEILLMDYLKYSASLNTSHKELLGSEYKFTKKLYDDLSKDLVDNTLDYIDYDMPVEEAENTWKRANDIDYINTAINELDDGYTTVKAYIDALTKLLVLYDTKAKTVELLIASRDAAGNNIDYIRAVNNIIDAINSSDIEFIALEEADHVKDKLLDEMWDILSEANPVMKGIDYGVIGLDMCFDTSTNASNDLKLALLYNVDSYMNVGLSNAFQKYLSDKSAKNAQVYNECFGAYMEFQIFGNVFAKEWLDQYLDGGVIKDGFNSI